MLEEYISIYNKIYDVFSSLTFKSSLKSSFNSTCTIKFKNQEYVFEYYTFTNEYLSMGFQNHDTNESIFFSPDDFKNLEVQTDDLTMFNKVFYHHELMSNISVKIKNFIIHDCDVYYKNERTKVCVVNLLSNKFYIHTVGNSVNPDMIIRNNSVDLKIIPKPGRYLKL